MATSAKQFFPVGPILLVMFTIAGSIVAYYGIRGEVAAPPERIAVETIEPSAAVVSIMLPAYDPDLPPGPHRDSLRTSCMICHSTQLILNQPLLPKKKWEETVHKMVTAYGAPVSEAQQKDVLSYLQAIRGKE